MAERYTKILSNRSYNDTLKAIVSEEKSRRFCRHGSDHLVSVARIAYILSLENNLKISKDLIYAAALLHDLGRLAKYRTGESHAKAGAKLAAVILSECGYSEDEISLITEAILSHGHESPEPEFCRTLGDVLQKADTLSRLCFECEASDECYWSENKKNHTVIY